MNNNSSSYIKDLEDSLASQNKMLELLNNRLVLIDNKLNSDSDDFEKNEMQILALKTHSEIYTLKKVIAEKKAYFEKYAAEFDVKRHECEMHYENTLDQAKKAQHKNPELKKFLENVDYSIIDSQIEYKVNFYERLKGFLNIKVQNQSLRRN